MAFFNNNTYTSDIPTIEALQYGVDFGGAANIAMEAYADQLEIVKAIHAADIAELRCKAQCGGVSEGFDASAELDKVMEAAGGNIFEKIKTAIKNFFGKIAQFFKDLYKKMFQMNMNNKAFSEKYSAIIKEFDAQDLPDKVEVTNTYPYISYDIIANYCEKVAEASAKATESISSNVDAMLNSIDTRSDGKSEETANPDLGLKSGAYDALFDEIFDGIYKGSSNNAESGSVTDMLYKTIRNGNKGTFTYKMDTLMKDLEAIGKFDVKAIQKAESKTTKDFNTILKIISKAEKTYNALPSDNKNKQWCVKAANSLSSAVNKSKSYVLTFMSVVRTCTNEMSQRTKNATIICIDEARKNKKTREEREKKNKK